MGEILGFVDGREILLQVDRCIMLGDLCQKTQPLRTQKSSSVKWGEYEAPQRLTIESIGWYTEPLVPGTQ